MPRPRRRYQKPKVPIVKRNHQIRAQKVRVIDDKGNNLGILTIKEALEKTEEAGLDLIEISSKTDPPITRIMDYGKYVYKQGKKTKGAQKKQSSGTMIKGVRLGMTTSSHDLEVKAKRVDRFLKKGYKVKVELIMRGREKGLKEIADTKIEEFLNVLKEKYKLEQEPKRYPRGLQFTIAPQ